MLGLDQVACPPSLIWFLQLFFPTRIDLRIIPHFSNNGSLTAKEVSGGWDWSVEVRWDEVSCICGDLELEMKVNLSGLERPLLSITLLDRWF